MAQIGRAFDLGQQAGDARQAQIKQQEYQNALNDPEFITGINEGKPNALARLAGYDPAAGLAAGQAAITNKHNKSVLAQREKQHQDTIQLGYAKLEKQFGGKGKDKDAVPVFKDQDIQDKWLLHYGTGNFGTVTEALQSFQADNADFLASKWTVPGSDIGDLKFDNNTVSDMIEFEALGLVGEGTHTSMKEARIAAAIGLRSNPEFMDAIWGDGGEEDAKTWASGEFMAFLDSDAKSEFAINAQILATKNGVDVKDLTSGDILASVDDATRKRWQGVVEEKGGTPPPNTKDWLSLFNDKDARKLVQLAATRVAGETEGVEWYNVDPNTVLAGLTPEEKAELGRIGDGGIEMVADGKGGFSLRIGGTATGKPQSRETAVTLNTYAATLAAVGRLSASENNPSFLTGGQGILDYGLNAIASSGPTGAVLQNYMASEESKKYFTDLGFVINAFLRFESGAVITPFEYRHYTRLIGVVPGDSPEVIARKQSNRQSLVNSLEQIAGDEGQIANLRYNVARSRLLAPDASEEEHANLAVLLNDDQFNQWLFQEMGGTQAAEVDFEAPKSAEALLSMMQAGDVKDVDVVAKVNEYLDINKDKLSATDLAVVRGLGEVVDSEKQAAFLESAATQVNAAATPEEKKRLDNYAREGSITYNLDSYDALTNEIWERIRNGR